MKRIINNQKIIILLFGMFIVQQLIGVQAIYGLDPNAANIDAMMVIDVSGSMKASDPNRLAQEAIKLFTDMMSVKGDKIGLVAYSHEIVSERAMVSLDDENEKKEFKNFVQGLVPKGDTDMSLGLKRAIKILETSKNPNNKPLMIILADGNNDLGKNNPRTEGDVEQDMKDALKEAKQEGYPMYTIGLNADGKLNSDFLKDISSQTGGKFFETKSADDLPEILSQIFADHSQLKVMNMGTIDANGQFQDTLINIPSANVKEANISLMSNEAIEMQLYTPSGQQVTIPSNQVVYSKSSTYGLLKILSPEKGDWTLKVKGVDGDKIKLNLIFNYNLGLGLDAIPSTVAVGDTIDLKSFFESNETLVQDTQLYKDVEGYVLIKDMDTLEEEEVPLTNTGSSFEGSYTIPEDHAYEVKAIAQHSSFIRESSTHEMAASAKGAAKAPVQKEEKEEKPFPWQGIINTIGALVAVIVGALGFIYYKKMTKPFVGQMVIERRDDLTGKITSPIYKELSTFKGKMTLHQLLQLDPTFKETEKILFTPAKNDKIIMVNNGDNNIQKSGRIIDAAQGYELKDGDKIIISLHHVEDTIHLEYLL